MSIWSGLAAAGLVLVLASFAVAEPLWEFRVTGVPDEETWSYGLFGATHTVRNGTTNLTTVLTYDYYALPGAYPEQQGLAVLLIGLGKWFVLSVILAIAGIGLSALTALRKLRGLFAAFALLGACAFLLYAGLDLVLQIPAAASPLGAPYGTAIPDFRGQISSPPLVLSFGPGWAWFFVLIMGLAAGFGASETWNLRPAPKKQESTAPIAASADVPAPAPAAPAPPVVEVAPAPSSEPRPEEPDLEEVFLIAPSGLLVKHMSRSLMTDKDRDVVGGMIAVVSNFVREAFTERDGEVQEVTLGEHRFILCTEDNVVLAVLVRRGETEAITHRLRHILSLLLDRYGERLTAWNGIALPGIEDELSVLWEPFFVPPPPAE